MRQLHTFVLTLLPDGQDAAFLRGRVRAIATTEEATFVGLDELIQFIRSQVEKYGGVAVQDNAPGQGLPPQRSET
jgi:hypothetical protein